MVSLLDIVPQTTTVEIAAGPLELRGLGLRHIAGLLLRFPELRKLITPGAPDIDVEALIAQAPDAVAAIVAEAAGQPEAADRIAETLSLGDLAECLEAVLVLTMPSGMDPLERLARVLNGSGGASLSVPNGRDRATNTPLPPSN